MSIKDVGHLNYLGHDCVYVQDNMDYIVIPVNPKENIYNYFQRCGYTLNLSDGLHKKAIVSVKQTEQALNHIRITANYIAKLFSDKEIDGFVMVGNEIDEFFSPLEHYHILKNKGEYVVSDLLYGQEIGAKYQFFHEGKSVEIDLVFGNILSKGSRSDLSIHPQLVIHIDRTANTDYIYSLAGVIIRFMQFVHRKKSYNLKSLELFHCVNGKNQSIGYLFESLYNIDLRPKARLEASYKYYGDKIGNLLSIISSDSQFPLSHLHNDWHNSYGYSTERFGALCSAFEHEYGSSKESYEKGTGEFGDLREHIVEQIQAIDTHSKSENEFKQNAIGKIKSLGTQSGFFKRILNAYEANSDALGGSVNRILIREKDLRKIARQLSDLRGKVLHNEMGYRFNEQEMEAIRFLEILQFVMTLRRAKYSGKEIELIIGRLYYCNDTFWNI